MATQAEPNMPEQAQERGPVWSVCGQITYLSNGDGAALRRMYLTRSLRADGIVEKLLRRARVDVPIGDDAMFDSWRLLAHAAAVISGTGKRFAFSDSEARSLGRSLHTAGVKEMSVLRLISARGPALADQIRRIARILARGGSDCIPTNLGTLRELADPDPVIAEQARRLIARTFYAAADAADRKDAADKQKAKGKPQ